MPLLYSNDKKTKPIPYSQSRVNLKPLQTLDQFCSFSDFLSVTKQSSVAADFQCSS